MANENDMEHLKSLEMEVAEELANVQFFESNAYPAFEKSLDVEIKQYQDVLFNKGKPTMGDVDHIRVNEARVEIAVRNSFLERFRNSVPRYKEVLARFEDARKEQS